MYQMLTPSMDIQGLFLVALHRVNKYLKMIIINKYSAILKYFAFSMYF